MPNYVVRFNGSIEIIATNKEDAEKQARDIVGPWPMYHALEIGKDCDVFGWDIPKHPVKYES